MNPLQVHPLTGKSCLPLRRHPNIVLGIPSLDDIQSAIAILNDPLVYAWLYRPPFPYLQEHGQEWFSSQADLSEELIQNIKAVGPTAMVSGCPVSSIYEIQSDGSQIFIGAVGLTRCGSMDLVTRGDKESLNADNSAKSVGDPSIVWEVGYYLAPSHHRQGIMSDAVDTLIQDWAIPRMGARRFLTIAFEGNEGSLKVLQNCGFQLRPNLVREYMEAKGVLISVHVLDYTVSNQ